MMGTGGGPTSSSTQEVTSLASGVIALGAIASLLEIVSNPAAAKATLKELIEKSEVVKAQLAQAEASRKSMEDIHRDVTAKQEKLLSDSKDFTAKDASLRKREDEVALRLFNAGNQERALESSKQALRAKELEYNQKLREISSREQDSNAKIQSAEAQHIKSVTDRKAAAEIEHAAIVEQANKLLATANEQFAKSTDALALAEKQKKLYEKRVASLKQIMQDS